VHVDERSSGFFAVGIARTTRRPVLVITSSGTAAAELHPAIVEARYGRAPLIAVTADRPFDLRDVGAPQTIDQQGLFGRAVLWAHDIEATAHADPSRVVSLAARLVSLAGGACGPVHQRASANTPPQPMRALRSRFPDRSWKVAASILRTSPRSAAGS
jgi:2-succinyl-5-enolpyruvyl-6-hydroxy-3-cyclohexene-1-carboxylate synthase